MWQTLFNLKSLVCCLLFLAVWNGAAFAGPAPAPRRIVSLAPAMTEIIFSLGLGARVVGVTTVCDRPREALLKPKVGGMDNPSLEAIVALKPDLVVLNSDGNPKLIADRLAKMGIPTHIFLARRLSELPAGIRAMGRALGAQPAADRLAGEIEQAIRDAARPAQQVKGLPAAGGGRKALFVIWTSPLIVAGPGTILDDAMRATGLSNIASDAKIPYPRFSLESVLERKPDLILIGKGHNDMKNFSKGFLKSLGRLEAVRQGRVYFLDDALYRPGPRIPAGLAELARCGKMP